MVNIYLVGFMGAGKTSVGEMLARHVGAGFLDLDAVLCDRFGSSIPEVFADHGEAVFRAAETEELGRLAASDGLVVATGGGTFAREENRQLIDSSGGISVYLDLPWEELSRRLGADNINRPKFVDLEHARELFDTRVPSYRRAAVTIGLAGDERPSDVAKLIAEALREAPCAT